ncbi:hypothetical protein MNBD_GAMMA24-2510 [hydrothermal vent metagenome]|uniref:Uncharacterized protein n=1 Tax=hydrothermal vent metagenome TaxID=652676 RepID=A0A3B1BZX6_9ZZZZ
MFVVVTSVFLYGLYLQFFNKETGEQTTATLISFPHTDCKPERKPCSVSLGDRQLRFNLPKKAFYLRPFPVLVLLTGFTPDEIKSVSSRFEMTDMNMGFNQVQLSEKNRRWQGQAILPVCSSGSHDWLAVIEVKTGTTVYRARFNFSVENKH